MFIGIELTNDLSEFVGALTVIEGKGKYIRVVGTKCARQTLDPALKESLSLFRGNSEPLLLDWQAIREDIAMAVTGVAEELKLEAGKYVDRLMTIAISDPGAWHQDSSGSPRCFPLCDPELVAEMTGISVVDSFAVRDLYVGGNATGLKALPAWLLFADRSKPKAIQNRLLLQFGETCSGYFLPSSDGLDIEIPEIQYRQLATGKFMNVLKALPDFHEDLHELNIQGQGTPELVAIVRSGIKDGKLKIPQNTRAADLVRSFVVALVDEMLHLFNASPVDEIIVDSAKSMVGSWINQVQRVCPNTVVKSGTSFFDGANVIEAVMTSILGAMNVDQLPGNIPWLTGATAQRQLGRIVPGNPSNWRLLVREMADFQPPAMRLRDAI